MAAEEWSQLPLFSSMSSHASSPLSERPLPILSGQDAMTSAGISYSPTCPTAPRRIVFIPTFGRSGTKSPRCLRAAGGDFFRGSAARSEVEEKELTGDGRVVGLEAESTERRPKAGLRADRGAGPGAGLFYKKAPEASKGGS